MLYLLHFLVVLCCVVGDVVGGKQRGITWGLTERLENLNFADDIFLLSHIFNDAECKLFDLEKDAEVCLKINPNKRNSVLIIIKRGKSI